MRRVAAALIAGVAAALLAACVPSPQPPAPGGTPEPGPPSAPEPSAATPGVPQPWAKARTPLEAYKQDIAQRVMVANATHGFNGVPPHFLRAVIVVQMTVDRSGKVTSSRILRSPGDKPLEQLALASLKRAEPLAPPPPTLLVNNRVEMTESFLFRNDGKFQIRSLAAPQPAAEAEPPRAQR